MLSFFWRRQCPWMSLCMHHILSKRGRGLVAIYCLAVPLLGWYFVFIQTQEYDLFSPKPARLPSNTLINQRLLRQPLYNPAIQEIKLPENYCICAHNLQSNANVYNTALHSSQLCKKRRRSITTKKKRNWLGENAEQSWNVLRRRRRGELGNRWKEYFFQRLYKTPDDEPWMHSLELTSALHPLSGPTQLSPTSHTKPISTLHWQAIQWGKRNIDGLWLAAFCSLSVFQ